jgi:hypothetical protein
MHQILVTTFSAFQKIKIWLLLIYQVVMWETNFYFFRSSRSPKKSLNAVVALKSRVVKSSKKNATQNVSLIQFV